MIFNLLFLITSPLYCFDTDSIENSILGVPKVSCEEQILSLDVITEKPFIGNIFVKGRAKDSSCKQSYDYNNSNSYKLSLGECGMRRLRSVNPRGVNFIITIIVSFHPSGFITKNDRAFHVKCFYMETDTIVTSAIYVSPLATTEINDELKLPTCQYTVRRDSINGPQLSFANVGETVFHVWECDSSGFGMLIRRCSVTDGEGNDHQVLDSNGCSLDKFLLTDLIYDSSLMKAYASSQVFKYADSNRLLFTCQIQLCRKALGFCSGVTPPNCSESGNDAGMRNRRSISNFLQSTLNNKENDDNELTDNTLVMDINSPEMLIGGIDDILIQTKFSTCFSPFLVVLSNFVLFSLTITLVAIITVLKKETRKTIICTIFILVSSSQYLLFINLSKK